MIKSLVVKLAKRYAVNAIQEAVACRQADVSRWSVAVGTWLARARLVVAFLERLASRLADGQLSDAEVTRTTEELTILADEVTR